jgi:hypothetical protein
LVVLFAGDDRLHQIAQIELLLVQPDFRCHALTCCSY